MQVGLIGAGNMARALARGWGEPVLCSDSGSGRAAELAAELGGRAAGNPEVARGADVVVLCHKPYQLADVAAEIAGDVSIVVSVLGGITLAALQGAYPAAAVFRMEPNTPVEVGRGVVSYAAAPDVDPALEARVVALFERVGWVAHLPERLMGAAGGLSGVGPAYVALVAEAQIDAAVRHGIAAPLAAEIVTRTLAGTAELLAARDHDTLVVRREVTSPGGSTARGLDALERGGLRAAFSDALDRVVHRDAAAPGGGPR